MKCKDCEKNCKYRSSDPDAGCQVCKVSETGNWEIVKNCGLLLENGRIYKVEEHQKQDRCPYEVKVDVTDEIKRILKED